MTVANQDTAFRDLRANREDRAPMIVRRSILSRMMRASARFLFVFLVGVGVALGWQSYGDEAIGILKTQAPSLAEWLPTSTGRPADAPRPQLKPAVPPADQEPMIAPAGGAELAQQLKPIAMDLTALKDDVGRLAAHQEKISQSIDRLERLQQALAQKVSSAATSSPPVHTPTQRPIQHPTQPAAQAPSRPLPVTPSPLPRQ
jgi:hypothetical protein